MANDLITINYRDKIILTELKAGGQIIITPNEEYLHKIRYQVKNSNYRQSDISYHSYMTLKLNKLIILNSFEFGGNYITYKISEKGLKYFDDYQKPVKIKLIQDGRKKAETLF